MNDDLLARRAALLRELEALMDEHDRYPTIILANSIGGMSAAIDRIDAQPASAPKKTRRRAA